jgi:hypothetical protein
MICSGPDEVEVAAEDDGDAPDRLGAYGFDGVAMLTVVSEQPGPVLLLVAICMFLVPNYQQRCGYSVAVSALNMGWRRRGGCRRG